ncbi:MAG: hypothetical protein KME57_03455 [Scytonema hyalinum WJT4-NPBG1]|nr:hypothetical protein [Scytonema hyalinum WJT4-NPBG1]
MRSRSQSVSLWDSASLKEIRQSPLSGNPFGYACGTPDGERQLPAEGNPPSALVSPPAALAH